jgi:transcriptional regulator with XRE-family HTH domain
MKHTWLKEQRERLGLSQEELAARLQAGGLDVTRATVSHWETGRYQSPLDSLQSLAVLAEVLQTSLDELLAVATADLQTREYSKVARQVAFLVDRLTPEGQQIALEQLKVLEKYLRDVR